MGRRIAILVGVSTYQNENDLPPCEEDLALMTDIVSNSDKFDEFIVLNDSPKSGDAKDSISSFVRRYHKQEVDEVFFYFTGHGTRRSDDFLFLFSDYNSSKPEQTSLRNSELDSMLKSLNPDLAVKVVDACQSGTEYIKSDQDLKGIFEKSATDSFNKTYFFFSSSSTESSITSLDFSVFTKSFAKSLADNSGKDVRYRDIMAYISDDVSVTRHQTPLFIQQANNTEVFCTVSTNLFTIVSKKLGDTDSEKVSSDSDDEKLPESEINQEEKIITAISLKSNDYCNEEDAGKSLKIFVDTIESYDWGNLINKLYSLEVYKESNYDKISNMKSVAEWLVKSDEQYFAKVIYSEEEYQVREKVEIENIPSSFSGLMGTTRRIEYKPVTRYRKAVDSIHLTASSPCISMVIELSPKEEILSWRKVFIVFIFSKSKLTIFFKMEKEKEVSWNRRITQNENEWKLTHCKLKSEEEIIQAVGIALSSLKASLTYEITTQFDGQEI